VRLLVIYILWNKTPNLITHEIFPVSLEMKHAGVRARTTTTSPLYRHILSEQIAVTKRTSLAVGIYLVTIWAGRPDIIRYFRGFPHFPQVNVKITPLIGNKSLLTYSAQ
jgi:hypothetical protein